MKSCRVAFKIAYNIGNMRLERIQHRLLKGSWVLFNNKASICKGLLGRHAITWMERYFSKKCDIMPTTGRLQLCENFTRHEVYQAYKDDMLLYNVHFIQYRHFNRLWRLQFNKCGYTAEGPDGCMFCMCQFKKHGKEWENRCRN